MNNSYFDLIKQSYGFPKNGFNLKNDFLTFNDLPLQYFINKYKTPFKLIYLPKIGEQINKANGLFNNAIEKNSYSGKYHFCYCTKCNHYYHVVNETLKYNANLETSSSFDIDLILKLFEDNKIDKNRIIIHNGYKTSEYLFKIMKLHEIGFKNSIIVLDSTNELLRINKLPIKNKIKIGLRVAVDKEAQFAYHTSRLGIRSSEIIPFYNKHIKSNSDIELKMLHFFVDSGIKNSLYYWGEFQKALNIYIELKKQCTSLDSFNLGGGFPIKNHMGIKYDYKSIINKIIKNIKNSCVKENIEEPDIYTEFGKYTVGESSAIIFKVLEQKQQNDKEMWYIINNSLMNTIPDAWSIHEKFILLPINKWKNEYHRVNIGGISCDHFDYYNSEDFNQEILLPKYSNNDNEALYLGFFHTGAYQDAISGYGGIKHCLIPSPKYIIVNKDENGNLVDYLYKNEQSTNEVFDILGYK